MDNLDPIVKQAMEDHKNSHYVFLWMLVAALFWVGIFLLILL